jgi:hypothetical protein
VPTPSATGVDTGAGLGSTAFAGESLDARDSFAAVTPAPLGSAPSSPRLLSLLATEPPDSEEPHAISANPSQ